MNPIFKIKKKIGKELADAYDQNGVNGILQYFETNAKKDEKVRVLEPPKRTIRKRKIA